MKTIGRSLISIGWLLLGINLPIMAQQDAVMSQYMFNQLVFNPSYAGINDVTNLSVNLRSQWSHLPGSPNSQFFSGSTSIIGGKVGLGAVLINDKIGVNQNTQVNVSYAYKIQFADKTFSFGLQTGILTAKITDTGLNLKVPDDPFFQAATESATKVNFGAGVSLMSDSYFIGISVPRLMNTNFESKNINLTYQRHFYVAGAYIFQVSPTLKLKPMVLLKAVKGAPVSVDVNASLLLMNKLWVGAFTNNFSSLGGMVQFELLNAYKIGYSYETQGKNLTGNGLPTHEIMLSADLALLSHQTIFQRFF